MNSAWIYDVWLLLLTLGAAFTDARSGTIPNRLTLLCLVLAPLVHALRGGPGALAWSVAGAVACGLVPLAMFRRGAMGGGDVKLYAAVGALAGAQAGLELQLVSYMLAAGTAACWLLCRGELVPVLRRTRALLGRTLWPRAAGGGTCAGTRSEDGLSVRLGPAAFAACVLLSGKRALELLQ